MAIKCVSIKGQHCTYLLVTYGEAVDTPKAVLISPSDQMNNLLIVLVLLAIINICYSCKVSYKTQINDSVLITVTL